MTMQRLLIVLFMLCLYNASQAQLCKDCFSFQGVARDASGHIAAGKSISLKLGIVPFFQTLLYSETHKVTTNAQGIFQVNVGGGTVQQGNFNSIAWENNSYFLQVEIDVAGGENYTNLGATQLVSVPYALRARQSGKWFDFEPVVQYGSATMGGNLPAVGDGPRLVWYPKKYAFMSGYSEGNTWRDENIGVGSVAFGLSSIARGDYSNASGTLTTASGNSSFSAGNFSEAKGAKSAAFGTSTVAEGANSFAAGDLTKTTGSGSFATGLSSQAKGHQSMAAGNGPIAFGNSSTALGYQAVANGDASLAAGAGTLTKAFGSIALGAYNNIQDNPAGGTFAQVGPNDRIFQIGNGGGPQSLSNALTVLRNGKVGLGNGALTPQYILDIDGRPRIRHNTETAGLYFDNSNKEPKGFLGMKNDNEIGFYLADQWRFWVYGTGGATLIGGLEQVSDRRMKRDFTSLTKSLDKVLQLKGYHYYWKEKTLTQSLQTGFIAQEVEALFPELVSTSETGVKAVNYVSLIPHLVEAIKELKRENESLKDTAHRVDELEENVQALMKMVTKSTSRSAVSK